MPRKAKDENLIEKKETKKATKVTKASKTAKTNKVAKVKKSTSSNSDKKTATKKTTTKKKSTSKVTSAKSSTKKKTTKKNSDKTPSTKKVATKKSSSTKSTTTKKTEPKKTTTRKRTTKKIDIVEYYDLPYRYNETTVKVLAQTPDILFVYWDISDEDKQNYISKYGEFFFNDTKPVLIIHNDTMNYSFEVEINDYANSWYLHIKDSNCDYSVELGRRPINQYAKINDYLYISSSNEMDAPNDHILFDTIDKIVYFKNAKTNILSSKDISLSFLTKLGKLYNIKEFYKKIYKDENIDFDKLNLKNMPSS